VWTNPLDVTDADDARWLSCLAWPGEGDRAERLTAAIGVACRDPPHLVRGDLAEQLAETAASASDEATLVVFHSAVLVYVSSARRAEFARAVAAWARSGSLRNTRKHCRNCPALPVTCPFLSPA